MEAKAKQIIIVKSNLEVLNVFAEALGEGFIQIGYRVLYIDLREQISTDELSSFFMNPVVGCLGINNSALLLFGNSVGQLIFETLNIPHVNILVDNPIYYISELLNKRNDIVITIDQGHMRYVADNYPSVSISAFLPHGGKSYMKEGSVKRIKDRSIDVFYAGSLHVARDGHYLANIGALDDYDFDYADFNNTVLEKMYSCPEKGFFEVIDETLFERDIVINYDKRQMLYYNLINCERVVCSSFRERLIYSIAKSGINLTLCGCTWEQYKDLIELPNVNFLGAIEAEEVLKHMADSKIVLNHLTWFKEGAHERIFNGMLAGAVVISDTSKYLQSDLVCQDIFDKNIKENAQLFTYTLGRENDLPDRIKAILSDEKLMDLVAVNGMREAKANHTWHHRAKEMDEGLFS